MADEFGLTKFVSAGAFERGRDYFERGHAQLDSHLEISGTATGLVYGSAPMPYQVNLHLRQSADGRVSDFDGDCSCPVGVDCKHSVAIALTVLAKRTQRPAGAAQPLPAWERSLGPIRDARRTAVGAAPLALGFEALFAGEPGAGRPRLQQGYRITYVKMRPLTTGKQGRWVRSGVSWTDLTTARSQERYEPGMLRLLRRIQSLSGDVAARSYRSGDPWVWLDLVADPAVWDVLAEAVLAGVSLVEAATQRPVTVADEQAEFELQLRRVDDGLVLDPRLTLAGVDLDVDRVIPIGEPAHGLAIAHGHLSSDRTEPVLQLARLRRTQPGAIGPLLVGGTVRVPADDEPRFVAEYLPTLVEQHPVTSPDDSFVIPEPAPPLLVGEVLVMPGHRIELRWHWEYRHGDDVRLVALDEPPTAVGRRVDQERQVLAAVVAVAGRVPALLGNAGRELRGHLVTSLRDSIRLVTDVLPVLRSLDGVLIEVDGTLTDFRSALQEPVVELAATSSDSTDWFELAVSVSVDGENVEFVRLFSALAAGEKVFVLPSGLYFKLDTPQLQRLRELIAEAKALRDKPGGLRISRYQTDFWHELEAVGVPAAQSARWLELVARFEVPDDAAGAPPAGLTATLRPYQLDGFRWLDTLRRNDLGGVLADDMGLGKTVQALAMIVAAREENPDGPPFLVVAPTSVVGNWQSEAARFAPGLRTAVVSGTGARREQLLTELAGGVDVLITSYTLLRLEAEQYQAISFAAVVLDEAQAVKNHQAKAFAAIKRLDRRFTVAITGTPLENHLLELWALFSLVAPGLFPGPNTFTDYYRRPIEKNGSSERLAQLRRRIGPFLLRRTKKAVAPELPEKQEQLLEVTLEPDHRKFYDRHLQRERQKVLGMLRDLDGNRFAIFRSLTLLRQASIDPALVDPAATAGSTKLTVLRDLIDEVVAGGHRALVFSQFTTFLGRVRRRLDEDGIGYGYLDGSTRHRPEVVQRFRSGADPVFLISLKAGGVGLNLSEADYCILLDPWWNPATEAQAVDRAHRIGQQRTVLVYRLVAKDTIEERVMAMQAGKAQLFENVLGGTSGTGGTGGTFGTGGPGGTAQGINAQDIRELLR